MDGIRCSLKSGSHVEWASRLAMLFRTKSTSCGVSKSISIAVCGGERTRRPWTYSLSKKDIRGGSVGAEFEEDWDASPAGYPGGVLRVQYHSTAAVPEFFFSRQVNG